MNTSLTFAGPNRTTYQAKIVKPDGYPLESSSVNFKFTILNPDGDCILYAETYSSVNMSSTGGLISFSLGSGVKTYPVSATTFEQVFSNITPTLSCDAGGPPSYSPASSDARKIVMQFHDGAGWQTLPAMSINAVPYAMYASEASSLNGKTDADFVQLASVPTCLTTEALRYNGTSFSCVSTANVSAAAVVSALGYTPADAVSVTALSSSLSTTDSAVSAVSASVFSVTADVVSVSSTLFSVSSTVSSLAITVSAITSSQWTSSGTTVYFNSGSVGIGTDNPITTLEVSGGVRISMEAAACSVSFAGTLRYNSGLVEYCNGASWSAFGVAGAGITLMNGSSSGTQTFVTGISGTNFNITTNNGVHSFNVPLAATGSVTAGLLSNADYVAFNNKVSATSSSVITALGYTPASASTVATAQSNINSVSATVASLTTNTAASFAAITSSQWLTSGSTISYSDGFVGIGTNAPATALDVAHAGANHSGLRVGDNSTQSSLTGLYLRTTSEGRISVGSSADMTFYTNTPNGNERMRILSSGRVGIGTSAPVTKLDVAGGVKISMEAATCAASYAGTLRYNSGSVEYCNGTTWAAFGVSTSGLTSLNGSSSQTQTFANGATGTQPAYVTTNGVHTLNIPLASAGSVTAGLLSNADYVTFSNKVNATSAAIISALGYTPANNAASGTYAVKSNNLSDLTSATAARTNLGLGSIAVLNSVDLSGSQANGILAEARLPSFANITSGTQYTKVTVDGKGRVTSGAQLSVTDVTTALGYTPASASASTQWATSGTTINYLTGNVGIGIASPQEQLHLSKVLKFTNTTGVSNFRAPTADSFRIFNHDDNGTGNAYGTGDNNAIIFENVDSNNPAPDDSMYFINHGSSGPVHALAIKGSGNVGIGLINPLAKLHLTSGSTTVAPVRMTAGNLLSSPQAGAIEYDGTSFYVTDGANSRKAIVTDTNGYYAVNTLTSSGHMILAPTGSVFVSSTVVSTNSNTGALVVSGGVGVAGNINAGGNISTTANMQAASITATSGFISPYIAGGVASGGNITIDSTTNAGKGNIYLNPNGGKVGIGYTSPLGKLHIGGSISGAYRSWMDNGVLVGKSGDSDGGYFGLKDEGANRQDTVIAWGDDVGDTLRFIHTASGGASDGAEAMRITAGGNVGIGTSAPAQRLSVNGDVSITGDLKMTGNDSYIWTNGSGTGYTGIWDTANSRALLFTSENSGNVGIRTTAPITELDVSGSILVRGQNIFMNNDAGTNVNNDYFNYDDNAVLGAGGVFSFFADSARGLSWTGATGAIAARNGYFANSVSIGTSITTRTLEVNGSINAGGMVAETFTFAIDGTVSGTWAIGSLSNNGTVVHATFDLHVHNGSTIDALKFQVSLPTYSNGTFYTGWQELPVAFGSSAWNGQKNYVVDVLRTSASSGNPIFFRVRNKNGNGSPSTMKVRMTYNSDQTFTRITHVNTVGTAFNAGSAAAGGPVDGMYGALEYSFPVATGQGWRPADNTGLFIKNSGYVGVGIGAPISQFHIASGPTMTNGYSRNLTLHAQHPALQFKGISDTNHSGGIAYDAQAISEALRFYVGATSDDFTATGIQAMTLTASGNVGIGTALPSEKLEVSGSVKATAYLYTSDRRLKKDIITLPDALANVLKLRGVNFVWKNNNEKTMGFIAQEVEEVYPELVKTDKVSGFKAVQYGNIVAILVEAIKQENKERLEAQNRCETQIANVQRSVANVSDKSDARINQLEKENLELKSRLEKIEKFLNDKVK